MEAIDPFYPDRMAKPYSRHGRCGIVSEKHKKLLIGDESRAPTNEVHKESV